MGARCASGPRIIISRRYNASGVYFFLSQNAIIGANRFEMSITNALDSAETLVFAPKDSGERVHVLLCTNASYLQHAAVCLTSLLANNPDLFFDIILVGRASEVLDEDKVRRSLGRFSNFVLAFQKFSPPSKQLLPLNPGAHYTLDNWTRLWLSDFFPDNVDRVLYLDCDIVIVGSVAALWNVDLDGALLGAVDIPGSEHGVTHLGLRAEDGYFNSGVLLIDLKKWRETG